MALQKPHPKVTAGAIAGVVVTCLTAIASLYGIPVSPEAATVATLVVSFVVSYFKKG